MTAPLVPPDIVIPRLPWVPVYADRLWESNFFAVATDAEFKAAFCLWLKSWNQKPPGSLPNDDRLLCRLAELNGNLAKWGKVKRIALRHWVECDDGRLYHPVVAELVVDAANQLNKKKARTEAARAARLSNRGSNRVRNALSGAHSTEQNSTPPQGPHNGALKNGAAPSPPINPKVLGHSPPCHCSNCSRWAALERFAEKRAAPPEALGHAANCQCPNCEKWTVLDSTQAALDEIDEKEFQKDLAKLQRSA